MYRRLLDIIPTRSFFLFGARGTGKTTFLREEFLKNIPKNEYLWIDLLDPEEEEIFLLKPNTLKERLDGLSRLPKWVIIDEVQKSPKLLNLVHQEIEARGLKFALTGSSARKLKKGGANLLAGRAFVNSLHPLSCFELKEDFKLANVLSWGSLPEVFNLSSELEKKEYLKSYVNTYLKEEIIAEQLVRNLVPFRKFLKIASQLSGTILNYNSIAKDLGVDWSTIKNYFEILEDTHLGFEIPSYSRSLRKQQLKQAKFYLFDIGAKRALDGLLERTVQTGQELGPLFEHFIVSEIYRLNHYLRKDYKLSYLATAGGLEIDLIIERPNEPDLLVEIKLTKQVQDKHLKHLKALSSDYPEFEAVCLCQEKNKRVVDNIQITPWQEGLREFFELDVDC